MSDLISRQAVKEWLAKWEGYIDADIIARMQYRIIDIPSAQPEPCEDAVSRQAVYNVLDKMPVRGFKKDGETIHGLISLSQVNSAIIDLPSAQPVAKDIDVPVKDCISRKAAIDALTRKMVSIPTAGEKDLMGDVNRIRAEDISVIRRLPSAQPEIVQCKDCVKHNKGHGYYLDGTVIGIKDCCPLVEIRGMAQGHEFDYQYCAYAERRTDD